jgi:uncharacterized repeat protein (TIGR01451 family)
MSIHRSSPNRSSKLFFFGAVAILIGLLVGTPVLRSAHSAGNESTSTEPASSNSDLRSVAGLGSLNAPSAALAQSDTSTKKRVYGNIDIRVNGQSQIPKVTKTNSASIVRQAQSQALAIQKGLSRLKANVPSLEAKISPLTGAVEVLRSSSSLTGPAPGRSGEDIVRSFIRNNSAVYGLTADEIDDLHFIGESVSRGSGLRMVRVEQVVNGLPVFQSETRFVLDRDGRLIRSTGLMIPQASATATAPALNQLLSAQEALAHAMSTLDISADAAQMSVVETNAAGTKTEVVANNDQIAGNVLSKLVYFPVAPGVLIPAWSQITFTTGDADWYTLVDASTGTLLWRKNIRNSISAHDARFRVYVQADGKTPADSPAPLSPTTATPGSGFQAPAIAPTIVSMHTAMDAVASPNGWINDCPGGVCTANETQTIGNNVHAYLDRVGGAGAGGADQPDTAASSVLDGAGKPTGNPDANARNRDFLGTAPRDFQTGFIPPPQGGNPEAGQTATGAGNNGTLLVDSYRRGAITQLFYVTNWYHDQLFNLGFDEAAGNFQQTNFSGMGLGNDRVLAEAQDSSGTDNANFSTPPDGQSGRAQMYRFTGPTIDRDGDLDAEILMHELTHGTSNRLIGNGDGLLWNSGGGMGEGWSDFVALSLLNHTNADNPDAQYASGAYATYKLAGFAYTDNYVYGIRRFPYSTDNSVNPLTWADVDDVTNDLSGGLPPGLLTNLFNDNGGFEVHNVGEIWALTLWEVRSRIIADPAGANGDVPTGNQTMLQIVIDAMKLTPINPSFTEARDALIDADCATNACANEQSIWDGFADRGLGYNAVAPLEQGGGAAVGANFGHIGIGESFAAPYLDVQTTTIDDSLGNNNGAIEPGEPIKITVKLKNPWRNASKNVAGALATLTSTTSGVLIIDGSSIYPAIPAQGSADGDTFLISVPTSATCGQSLRFTITSTSTLGIRAVDFVLRVGQAAGNGAPITYTRTPGAPIGIPDGTPRGVSDTLTITDDYEIADLNFRVDNIQHTYTGDLTAMLKAPNGYGTDLIFARGIFFGAAFADGDNFINTVIDDQSTNDLNQAPPTSAPFTGDWLPAFNSPIWNLFGDPNFAPDPVGQLSRVNGLSTRGTWTIRVSDEFDLDTGTINAWSLIVTPKAFTCAAFTPVANVTGTKTASGTFAQNGNITYTVTLTNNGSATQADNAGHEFTDVLPPQLTLVSATASSGTAVATTGTNTVTWDGSIPLLGGSVTITINATVKPDAGGLLVSNQGSISYDGDGNNTNEASGVTDDPGTAAPNDPTVISIACPTITLSALPDGTYNTAYSQTITASGGNGPYTFAVTSGTLPGGLTLTPAGLLSGTPTAAGVFNFTVTATDSHSCTGSQAYSLTINKAATTTTVTSSVNPSFIGQNVTFTATVSSSAGTPTGSVQFKVDGSNAGAPVALNASGVATYSTASLTLGTHTIAADYLGDSNFAPSTGALAGGQDVRSAVQLSSNSYSVSEAAGHFTITVIRSGDISGPASVDYETSDTSGLTNCDVMTGNASQRCDYTAIAGTLNFAAGDSLASFDIPVINDVYVEGPETFTLTLDDPTGGGLLGSISSATLTITDNDLAPGAANPIDDDTFFIRQQYLDILGREPDPPGLAGWLSFLHTCPAGSTACDRIELSSRFFRSPEFFDRAYYVYRFYETALGRKPTYDEYQDDLEELAGFLSDAELEARKAQFAEDFSQRPEFKAKYDSKADGDAYVNAIVATAGVVPSNRTDVAIREGALMITRGRALRELLESPEISAKFFNEAFVVVGYFAYLRREPDAQYLVWLNTLNTTGDYREMIRGFIESQEYRHRFGP